MTHTEHTSDKVASQAGRLLRTSKKPAVRSVAASALTQSETDDDSMDLELDDMETEADENELIHPLPMQRRLSVFTIPLIIIAALSFGGALLLAFMG